MEHRGSVGAPGRNHETAEPGVEPEILAALPDWDRLGPGLEAWRVDRLERLAMLDPAPALLATLCSTGLAGSEDCGPLGPFASPRWRKLALATWVADHACYPAPADRVDLGRLLHVLQAFPQGFRLWWVRDPAAGWLPVGYSGWHPIPGALFELLCRSPAELGDRGALAPLSALDERGGSYICLFNYSIVPPLQHGPGSRRLLAALAADLARIRLRGLAALTVSPAGARVASRFGLQPVGELVVAGSRETAYAVRLEPDARRSSPR